MYSLATRAAVTTAILATADEWERIGGERAITLAEAMSIADECGCDVLAVRAACERLDVKII
jgi:hypothetical protein